MSIKKFAGKQLKEYRHKLAVLKKKGLVSKRIDARSHKPTRHMLEQIKKYSDVIEGKAAVVHVPRSAAKELRADFGGKGRNIVVPKEKGERVRYDKKKGIVSTRTSYGVKRRVRRIKIKSNEDIRKLSGPGIRFVIKFGGGTTYRFDFADGPNGIITFMEEYEKRSVNPFKSWRQYVEVEEVEGQDESDIEDGDD